MLVAWDRIIQDLPDPRILALQTVTTTGTILVINVAEVIQLTEEFYAAGSLGSFNLQIAVQAQNHQHVA